MTHHPIEPLESRLCLSAPAVAESSLSLAAASGSEVRHEQRAALAQAAWHGSQSSDAADARMRGRDFDLGRETGTRRSVRGVVYVARGFAVTMKVFLPPPPPLPAFPVPARPPVAEPDMPAFNGPSHGNAVEPSSGGATAPAADVTAEPSMERKILEMEQAASADQAVAAAPRASLILDDSASPPIADELFAYGAVLAAASAHAGGEFGSQTTSVMARLASTWGGDIAAAVDIAGGAAAAWLPAEALAQLSDGARVAAAAAAEWLAPAAETVGSIIAPAAGVASYDIVHLGSPFALLADSVAAFVEESAAVQSAVAQAQPRGPWGLTFSVIAADLVVLSYVYRRKKARPRVRLAPLGAA